MSSGTFSLTNLQEEVCIGITTLIREYPIIFFFIHTCLIEKHKTSVTRWIQLKITIFINTYSQLPKLLYFYASPILSRAISFWCTPTSHSVSKDPPFLLWAISSECQYQPWYQLYYLQPIVFTSWTNYWGRRRGYFWAQCQHIRTLSHFLQWDRVQWFERDDTCRQEEHEVWYVWCYDMVELRWSRGENY